MSKSNLYLVYGVGGEYEEEFTAPLVATNSAEEAKAIEAEFSSDKYKAGTKYGIDADDLKDIDYFMWESIPGGFVTQSRTDEP